MIVEKTNETEAIYVGDIQENKVDIDRENIDFIASILTTNLYSHPLESFLRETISNGEDSQKEANVDEPLLLIIEPDTDTHFRITIRDFGTGISEEKFDKIYRKIGSSTKRESNEYIGHFGIGKFASLAVSDVVNIISYYNNKRYNYLMYKNGDGINIDKISVTEGSFNNGLEVSVRLHIKHKYALNNSINNFAFFEKLFLVDKKNLVFSSTTIDNFNNRKIIHHPSFSSCSCFSRDDFRKVLYGKVIYDIDDTYLPEDHYRGCVFYRFDIGSLDVTPNRESLRYSSKTVNSIKAKLQEFSNAFVTEVKNQTSKGFDSIKDWYKAMDEGSVSIKMDELTTFLITNLSKFKQNNKDVQFNYSINNEAVPKELYNIIKTTIGGTLPSDFIKYKVSYGTFYSTDKWINTDTFFTRDYYLPIITGDNNYSSITKKWIIENYKNVDRKHNLVVLNKNKIKYLKRYFALRIFNHTQYRIYKKQLNACMKMLFQEMNTFIDSIPCINNVSVPKWFKDSLKPAKVSTGNTKSNQANRKCLVQILGFTSKYCVSVKAHDHIVVVNEYDFQDFISKYKNKLIVYGSKNNNTIKTIASFYRNNNDKPIFVQIADTKLGVFDGINNAIEVNDFILSGVKHLKNIATLKVIYDRYKEDIIFSSYQPSWENTIFNLIHPKYTSNILKFGSLKNKYSDVLRFIEKKQDALEILNMYIEKGWFTMDINNISNPIISKIVKTLINYRYSNYAVVHNNYAPLFTFFIAKSGKILPSEKAYKVLKNNPLI